MKHAAPTTTSAPWYRYPIVWLIVAIPASAVFVGITLLTLAIRVPESVVRDDYYQAGRTINIDLRRTHTAADLGVQARFVGSAEDGWLLQVHQPRGLRSTEPVDVLLAHPTRARDDIEVRLAADRDGWSGLLEPMAGRRLLSISSEQGGWLLRGDISLDASDSSADTAIEVRAEPWGSSP